MALRIKNTVITVRRHAQGAGLRSFVIPAPGETREDRIRQYFHRSLLKAAAAKRRSAAFVIEDAGIDPACLLATAKILAQEIYRLLHEGTHSLRTIDICARGSRAYAACTKNTLVYMDYIEHKLKSPFLTVDAIIEYKGGIVLIRRSNPPFGWAIPGGFVDYGESLEQAAAREAKEETNLDIYGLRQVHTYSDPKRDPRFHTVCTVFAARGKGIPRAGDDAAGIRIVRPEEWKNIDFAFDHEDVLRDYLKAKNGVRII